MGHKIMAIFKLSAKEIVMNMSMLTSIVLPVVMALMFQRIDPAVEAASPLIIIYVVVGITYASVTSAVIMGMLAEENEQGILNHVIKSRKDMAANIIGKGILLFTVNFLVLFLCSLLLGITGLMNFADIIALIILWFFFFFMSAGFGMISKTVASSSLFVIIVLFIFAMSPYVELLIPDHENIVRQMFELTPLFQNLFIKEGVIVQPFIILTVWTIISFIFFMAVFNKKAKSL